MLEKPDIPNEKLIACLHDDYGIRVIDIVFLPLGADANTAVYRVIASGISYFLKLRSGAFDETTVTIPRLLADQGITQIIAPIVTSTGQLSTSVAGFTVILYPFVEGKDGFEIDLADHQKIELGAALKSIHSANIPKSLRHHTAHETYSSHWRDLVSAFQERAENTTFRDPLATELAACLQSKREQINHLVRRPGQLAEILRRRSMEHSLCHADIHAGNVLISTDGTLYLVDWDTLILAPKERDLMFVGGGIDNLWPTSHEEALFYQGYGQTEIDQMALTYYRYERIVQDIAAACEQLLLTDEGGEDRAIGLQYFLNQFLPDNVIDRAYQSDELLQAEGDPSPHVK